VFTETGYTAAHRSNTEALLGCLAHQLLSGVAASRTLPVKEVEAAMDAAPLLPDAALTAGLVDGVRYR
jgi:protease-4